MERMEIRQMSTTEQGLKERYPREGTVRVFVPSHCPLGYLRGRFSMCGDGRGELRFTLAFAHGSPIAMRGMKLPRLERGTWNVDLGTWAMATLQPVNVFVAF